MFGVSLYWVSRKTGPVQFWPELLWAQALRALSPGPERVPETVYLEEIISFFFFSKIFEIFLAGGPKPPETPPKRSFVTFDRGGQTGPPRSNDFFFGAADDTRAADDRPAWDLAILL